MYLCMSVCVCLYFNNIEGFLLLEQVIEWNRKIGKKKTRRRIGRIMTAWLNAMMVILLLMVVVIMVVLLVCMYFINKNLIIIFSFLPFLFQSLPFISFCLCCCYYAASSSSLIFLIGIFLLHILLYFFLLPSNFYLFCCCFLCFGSFLMTLD